MATPTHFTTPPGRMVQGSLYKLFDKKDDNGNVVLSTKPGAGLGLPVQYCFFAVAIRKGPERHWAETPWGAHIWAAGHQGRPTAGQEPTFAWKVSDGDSQIPNGNDRRPCDIEGFAGHWIVGFKCGWLLKGIHTLVGVPPGSTAQQLMTADAINLGDFIQVNFSAEFNGSTGPKGKPGVYINPHMVCLIGYGTRIVGGPDVASAGFGGPMPVGATATPQGNFNPAPAVGAAPPPPPPPGVPPGPNPMYAPPAASAGANPAYAGPAAAMPAPPPPSSQHVMLAAAQGRTYEQFMSSGQGWTDALLVQQGMMAAPVTPPLMSAVGSAPPPPPPAPIVVVANPAFTQLPAAAAPPPPLPPAARQMRGPDGAAYDLAGLLAQGWTEASLAQHGYVAA